MHSQRANPCNAPVRVAYSVLIVEDDPWFCDAFARAIRACPDLLLVGTAGDLDEARGLMETHEPDVVLIDLGLPSGSGIELVTEFGDDASVLRCIQAGATGYLLKDARDVDIVQQIRLLRGGGSPISPTIARQLVRVLASGTPASQALAVMPPPINYPLSERELSVLTLSGKRYNYEEIAALPSLSRHTVDIYLKRIYRKLQVHSKNEAGHEARRLGLVRD